MKRALLVRALALLLLAASPSLAQRAPERVEVSDDLAVLVTDGQLWVEARPLEGESAGELARRLAESEATVRSILAHPPKPDRTVIVPYELLSADTKRAAIKALFPSDVRATTAWLHIATGEERLSWLAAWFTGDARREAAIAARNGLTEPTIAKGTTVRIPVDLLLPAFRDAEAVEEEEPPKLEFGSDEKGRFAIYRIRAHEALYSAVVVRFTGRLHAVDVVELALRIAERSGIEDVHAIPIGYPVKIPLEVLSAEFLPKEDPRAQALASEKAEASQFAAPAKARGLAGVRIILDAGHGGRDTGTLHHGVWESTYVYDVACRLRKVLTETTQAEVLMTTREGTGWDAPDRDRLRNSKETVLLTTPPYRLEDPVLGVNLRWYLANAYLARSGKDRKPIAPERTVFLSLHADSLHPSVRGAMAYVPGERFLRDRFGKRGGLYATFAEWRAQPVVSFNRKERFVAEGVSTTLAEKILAAMRRAELPIHRFSPVRTHVIRGGREWVPAVLRYNRVPNRILLEIANLANEEDRELVLTRAFRQKAADAIAEGLIDFFGETASAKEPEPAVMRALVPTPRPPGAAAAAPAAPLAREIAGPWPAPPEIAGPWREVAGPWPGRGAKRTLRAAPAPRKPALRSPAARGGARPTTRAKPPTRGATPKGAPKRRPRPS